MKDFDPDRRLLGEDVIWTGDDETGQYYSSHRIVSPMHHNGYSMFGPPTGKPVKARTIADTVLRAEKVCEERLVRDHGAIIRQIGHDVSEFAAQSIATELERGQTSEVFTPEVDVAGTYVTPMSWPFTARFGCSRGKRERSDDRRKH